MYARLVTADVVTRLRRRGWRLSPQRRVVGEVLVGEHVHLTADEVHKLARARLPEISRATVYNTLRALVDMGELREVEVVDGPTRYDPNVEGEHDHLVCLGCRGIWDVPHRRGRRSLPGSWEGFVVTSVEVTYRGLCPRCAAARAS